MTIHAQNNYNPQFFPQGTIVEIDCGSIFKGQLTVNGIAKKAFEEEFAKRVETDGTESASDSGIGAIFKLRAVKNNDGTFTPIIRCGVTAQHLWEDTNAVDDSNVALYLAINELFGSMIVNTDEYFKSVPELQIIVDGMPENA